MCSLKLLFVTYFINTINLQKCIILIHFIVNYEIYTIKLFINTSIFYQKLSLMVLDNLHSPQFSVFTFIDKDNLIDTN